jgi:hypothetical protein
MSGLKILYLFIYKRSILEELKENNMAKMSAGKTGALKHNSGNLADNRKKGTEAGHKGSGQKAEGL